MMNNFLRGLFVICVLISFTSPTLSESDAGANIHKTPDRPEQTKPDNVLNNNSLQTKTEESVSDTIHSISDDEKRIQQREQKNKPLRNIVMGIYKNYKSTYLGNKTLTEYKQTLRESMKTKQQLQQQNESLKSESPETDLHPSQSNEEEDEEEATVTDATEEVVTSTATMVPELSDMANPQKPIENEPNHPTDQTKSQEDHYHIGPALNMSLDLNNSIVKVNLDGESLRELVTGRWLSDNSDEGNLLI